MITFSAAFATLVVAIGVIMIFTLLHVYKNSNLFLFVYVVGIVNSFIAIFSMTFCCRPYTGEDTITVNNLIQYLMKPILS